MGWASTGNKAVTGASASASLTLALLGTTAGNSIAVACSCWGNPVGPTSCPISDNINGSYAQALFRNNVLASVALAIFDNIAGGNVTITCNPQGATADSNDISIFAHEFSGGALTSSLSGSAITAIGTSTNPATGILTPSDADCLILGVLDFDSNASIAENAAGEGFILSNEREGLPQPGDLVYKIVSGIPSVSHSWTCGASAEWVVGLAAFKPFIPVGVPIAWIRA